MRQPIKYILLASVLIAGCKPQNKLGKIMPPVDVWEYVENCGSEPSCYDTAADHYFQSLELSEDILALGRIPNESQQDFSEAVLLGNKKTALEIQKQATPLEHYQALESIIFDMDDSLATPESFLTLLEFWDTDSLSGNLNRHDLVKNWDALTKDWPIDNALDESIASFRETLEYNIRTADIEDYLPHIFEAYAEKFLEQSKKPFWRATKAEENAYIRIRQSQLNRFGGLYKAEDIKLKPGWELNPDGHDTLSKTAELFVKRFLSHPDHKSIPNIERSLDMILEGLENISYSTLNLLYKDLAELGFEAQVRASIERRARFENQLEIKDEFIPYVRMGHYQSLMGFTQAFQPEYDELANLARETLAGEDPIAFFQLDPKRFQTVDITVTKIQYSLSYLKRYAYVTRLEADHPDYVLLKQWESPKKQEAKKQGAKKTLPKRFKKRDTESWEAFLTRIETDSDPKQIYLNLVNLLEDYTEYQRAFIFDPTSNQHLVNQPEMIDRIEPYLKLDQRRQFITALAFAGDPDAAAKIYKPRERSIYALQPLFIAESYAAISRPQKADEWVLKTLDSCGSAIGCKAYIYERLIALGGLKYLNSDNSPLFVTRYSGDENLYSVLGASENPEVVEVIQRQLEHDIQLTHMKTLPLIPLTARYCDEATIKPLHREVLERVEVKKFNFNLNLALKALAENGCLDLVETGFDKVAPDFGKSTEIRHVVTALVDNGHMAEVPKWLKREKNNLKQYYNFRLTARRLRLKQAYDVWKSTQ